VKPGSIRPGNLRARTRQLTSQAYEGTIVQRYSPHGERQGNASRRPAAGPRRDYAIDAYPGQDAFAQFPADCDMPSYRWTSNGRGADGTPGPSGARREDAEARAAQREDRSGGGNRRASRGAGKRKRLLVTAAAIIAVLTSGIALAAMGVGGIHIWATPPVTVQALGVDVSKAVVGQTVTADARVVAASQTTLSDVALIVTGPGGTRTDFATAHDWTVGTSQRVFMGSKTFSRTGTYTYWFMYRKNGHWIDLNPRLTFSVDAIRAAIMPAVTPSTPSSTAPSAGPTKPPTTTGPRPAGGSSGGSTPANPSQHGCASNPGTCGYPTTATAGVPAGTALKVVQGDLDVTTNGAVVTGKEIHGCIDVRAKNVTIRNTRIIGPCAYGVSTYSASGTTVVDRVEINCTDGRGTGLAGPNFAAHAVNIHDCENALEMDVNSSVVDSVLSARDGAPTSHGDGIQSQGGNNVVIRHNTLLVQGGSDSITSAIITNSTENNGWLVEDNLMGGGGYTLYCPEQGTNFTVRDNRFVPAKLDSTYSAQYGLTDSCDHAGITWTGNYNDSDGSAVAP
jgi:hypothetical protein